MEIVTATRDRVQIAGVDMPESARRKFGDARRRRPDKISLVEREKGGEKEGKKEENDFGVEVADGVRPSTNHLVTLQAAFGKEARKPATLPDKLDARLTR